MAATSLRAVPVAVPREALARAPARPAVSVDPGELRRLRSLAALFSLYAVALAAVVILSDGADVGCILAGIAGHVPYAVGRLVSAWRGAAWLKKHARGRSRARAPDRLHRLRGAR